MVTIQLKGFDAVERALSNLRVDIARRTVNLALKDCAEYTAREVANAAPIGSTTSKDGPTGGELRRSIRAAKRRADQNMQTRYIVGVDKRAFYWKFIEFGTTAHEIKAAMGKFLSVEDTKTKLVKHPGIAPQPFVRPTWDRVKHGLIRRFARHILDALNKVQK